MIIPIRIRTGPVHRVVIDWLYVLIVLGECHVLDLLGMYDDFVVGYGCY